MSLSLTELQKLCDAYNANQANDFVFVAPNAIRLYTNLLNIWYDKFNGKRELLLNGEILKAHLSNETDLGIYKFEVNIFSKMSRGATIFKERLEYLEAIK